MKKQLKYIILLLAAIAVLSSCDDPLGADDYIRNPVFRDSIPEIDRTYITYNFVKTINDTIHYRDTIRIEVPDTTGGAYPSRGYLYNGYSILEAYAFNSPKDQEYVTWLSDPNAFSDNIELNYRNGTPEISMELEVERSESMPHNMEYYINKFKFSFEDIPLDIMTTKFLNAQNGLKSEIELFYYNGASKYKIEGYDSPLDLFFIVQFHPDNKNIPLAMEMHLSADLTYYTKQSYREYRFTAQFLVLFH